MNDVIENKEIEENIESQEQPVEVELASGITTDKPDHSKARACLYVDGLSLLGFNPAKDRAEFAFFKDMHYPVVMKIYDKECKLVWSTQRKADFPYSTAGAEITVNASKKGMGQRYQEEPRSDNEDFGHLPSLPEWHGVSKMEVIPDTDNAYLSARLNINDATFYTQKMSANNGMRSVSGVPTVSPLGKVGRIPGADIFCSPGEKLEIEIKPLNLKDPVKISLDENNNPYKILVRVEINDGSGHASHLVHLYNVLKRPQGDNRTFVLEFDKKEPPFLICDEKAILSTQFECQVFVDSEGGW